MFSASAIRVRLIVGLLGVAAIAFAASDRASAGETDTKAASAVVDLSGIELLDEHARKHAADQYDEPILVLAFLGTECPLAKVYSNRLNDLHQQFPKDKVRLIGVDSNLQDTSHEIAKFARHHQLSFEMLKDPKNRLADVVGATRTPEVIVLDSNRIVRYRGQIDDQYGISIQRPKPTQEPLKDAVEQLIAGKSVSVSFVPAIGCLIGREKKVEPRGEITYAKDVASILNKRCVECHRSKQIAPFSLATFEDTQGWEAMIAEVVTEGRMPPWYADPKHGKFKNDARLKGEEKETLLAWIENGSPFGDAKDLPPAPKFVDGWRMPEPDEEILMRVKPYKVPAEGVVDYQYWRGVRKVGPDKFEPAVSSKDRYVSAVEARPDNASVVHHIIVYMRPPDAEDNDTGEMLIGYAPGSRPTILPEGTAIKIPAGWDLVFELHYTPNGREQTDRSYIGLTYVDEADVRTLVKYDAAMNRKFEIEAGNSDFEVTATKRIEKPLTLTSFAPHMHLRGKSFTYWYLPPGIDMTVEQLQTEAGDKFVLLDVPNYDFNWQLSYDLDKPKILEPEGQIVCRATFDNSADNPNHPEPDNLQPVKWGRQSFEEMMIGFYFVETDKD